MAPADTSRRRPHGTEGPRRQAPAGHATTPAQPTAAQTICGTGKLVPACSGFTATSMPPTAPAIKISRPAGLAGRSASPVTRTQAPTTTKVSDITHRSAAPTAASALTGSAMASTGRGCRPAAMLHPATISTGDAADGTTPHHGTPRTIHNRSWWYHGLALAPDSHPAVARSWPAAARMLLAGSGAGQVVLDPDVGFYVDRVVVVGVAVDRHQRLWHDHIAGAVEWQPGPGPPLR
jgi:hypothetical protein